MKIFLHHIYEYKKGLRNLVLYTGSKEEENSIKQRLEKSKISFFLTQLDSGRINVFFGDFNCVETIRSFGEKKLNEYTPEEDFILGIMLGYDRVNQCKRYLKIKDHKRVSPLKFNAKRRLAG